MPWLQEINPTMIGILGAILGAIFIFFRGKASGAKEQAEKSAKDVAARDQKWISVRYDTGKPLLPPPIDAKIEHMAKISPTPDSVKALKEEVDKL